MRFASTLLALSLFATLLNGCAMQPAPRLVYQESQFANRLEYLRFCERYAMQDGRCE
jgi:hypothetical protein